jgi:hypothetical protein
MNNTFCCRQLFIAAVMSVTVLFFASHSFAQELGEPDEEGFVTIFNGKDLTGWDHNPEIWSVENGVMIGQSPRGEPYNKQDYIYWAVSEPADFVLRLKYRLTGKGSNSGVQFRSERRPDWNCYGYQADMEEGSRWTGCLFHHSRGGIVMRGFIGTITEDGKNETKQFADPEKLAEKYTTEGEWNEYEIIAVGSLIVLKINGVVMCIVNDQYKNATKSGVIAFQMHPGPPMKAEFKDVRIKILDQ